MRNDVQKPEQPDVFEHEHEALSNTGLWAGVVGHKELCPVSGRHMVGAQ